VVPPVITAMHNKRMPRVLGASAWAVVYLVVVPVIPLLLMAIVASDRPLEPCAACFRLCDSQRDCLLLLTSFYCTFIAPFLVAVAWITVVAAVFTPRLRSVAAYRVAGLASVLAVVVVLLGWAIRYPDQLFHFISRWM
jgi:hypothetical protein